MKITQISFTLNIEICNNIHIYQEYTYISTCDIEFNVLIYFDYDNEVLLYSLKYEDANYNSSEYLVEYDSCFDEEKIYNTIKTFMLGYIENQISCYIDENEYSDWRVAYIKDGIRVKNISTNQYEEWNIHDFDDDFEDFQNEIKEFLDSNKGV